ncbi:tyrosine-protein phosphatase [Microlunatus parietis]|uniref:Protein tyrosine/serine phosphatase n=1 Tax=Microlunatus parietis TaxID=682979 RepID=A0A7Y9LCA4_9ACTN|nr:tyrosine-protein phosphatase [Microlunatus parietis]NYE74639.1 protein tyrosine/serine phosphatase [Microlunatus parietis]
MSLSWPDCLNVRDLGGLPTADGGRIAARALIRSDNLTRLTPAGVEAVRAARLGRIVDVRTDWECEHYPTPFAGDPLHCNRPLHRHDDPYDPALSLEQTYIAGLELRPEMYAAAIEAIASAPAGAVLVHCHMGKDRTGMIIALALGLAGVTADVIAADYAAVSDRLLAHFDELLAAVPDPTQRTQLAEEFSSRAETMITVLDHLEQTYGGVEAYLRHAGLGDDSLGRLRARLVGATA